MDVKRLCAERRCFAPATFRVQWNGREFVACDDCARARFKHALLLGMVDVFRAELLEDEADTQPDIPKAC